MIYAAVVLFAIAAVIGVALSISHSRGLPVGVPRALVHGCFAAVGLVVLLIDLVTRPHPGSAIASFIVFLLAALGGFVLFAFHVRKRKLPVPAIVFHGLIAVCAFVILLISAV